jgi:hypothetical protein
MSRRGDWLLVGAGLVLIVGAGVVLVEVFLLSPAQRSDVVGLGGFVLALAGAVVSVLGWLGRVRRPVGARPVNMLADLLAQGVQGQWRKAATERVLLTPAPISVRWSLSSLPVTGELAAALDGPFTPLPGLTTVTEGQLWAGGGRRELFAMYGGLASGRVVVVGGPGSGKSGSAVLLVLDALAHRGQVDDAERVRVPVPVLFTVHGWDPTTCSVGDWLAEQLAATYPMFQHRGGQVEVAALVAAGAVALILDGFDEMHEVMRSAALQALSDAAFRVVVLTRSQEMLQAAGDAWLVGAAALRLHDVTGPEGADYLRRARTGPPPSGWSQLLTHLREHPDSVLTRGLSTPLALSLIRDTYRAGDDVSDLLDARSCSTPVDLERHLIARVVPVAYTPRPGRSKPRYSLSQATQVLTFIARQMNHEHTRDLAWWDIPRWVPTIPRILASTLACGFGGGLTFALLDVLRGFPFGLVGALTAMLGGFVFGFGIGLPFGLRYGRGDRAPQRVRNWRAIRLHLVLTAGLLYGLACGFASGFILAFANNLVATFVAPSSLMHTLMQMLVFGLVFGLTLGPASGLIKGEGRPQGLENSWRSGGVFGLVLGLSGLGTALLEGYGLRAGLMSLLVFGLVGGLMVGLAGRLGGPAGGLVQGEERPRGPRESWRNDRMGALVFGLAIALSVSPGFVLVLGFESWYPGEGLARGLATGLRAGLPFALALGLVCGVTSSVTWPTTLAWLQLRFFHLPAVGLMPLLEDARARGVLRTVGAVYQFRHAILQDHLATQTTVRHTASPTIQRSL